MTNEAKKRKETPVFSGVLNYFPDAIRAVAEVSFVGNEQHNPGSELHWDRDKSTDELDALSRHLIDAGTMDSDGLRHSAKVAWRALANLQKEIEAEKNAIQGAFEAYHSQFPNKDGLHPREAREERVKNWRFSMVDGTEVTVDTPYSLDSEDFPVGSVKADLRDIRNEERGFTGEFKKRWSGDRMNVIGQNGNDGLHYGGTVGEEFDELLGPRFSDTRKWALNTHPLQD